MAWKIRLNGFSFRGFESYLSAVSYDSLRTCVCLFALVDLFPVHELLKFKNDKVIIMSQLFPRSYH